MGAEWVLAEASEEELAASAWERAPAAPRPG